MSKKKATVPHLHTRVVKCWAGLSPCGCVTPGWVADKKSNFTTHPAILIPDDGQFVVLTRSEYRKLVSKRVRK